MFDAFKSDNFEITERYCSNCEYIRTTKDIYGRDLYYCTRDKYDRVLEDNRGGCKILHTKFNDYSRYIGGVE